MYTFLKNIFFLILLLPCKVWATVNVVVIAPQEGEYAKWGRELSEGVEIAVADINSKGGVLGQQINLIVADDRCDDIYAVSMAQMLASKKEDKINLVIGPYCNNELSEVAEIYAKAKIMQIMPVPVRSDEQNSNSIAGLTKYQAQAFFEYYKKNFSGQNVALAYDPNDKETVETATELQALFAANNLINRLTVYSLVDFGRNYKQIAKEMMLNNRLVFLAVNNNESLQLKNAIFDMAPNVKVFANRYANMGKDKGGEYYLGLKSFKDSPYFTEILVNLRLQGKEPIGLGMYGFATLKFWSDTVTKAKSFDSDALKNVMNNHTFMMPWGSVKGIKAKLPLLYGVFERKEEEYTQVY